MSCVCVLVFFFQAEDGIRDHCVTGVQTCALPILSCRQRTWPVARSTAIRVVALFAVRPRTRMAVSRPGEGNQPRAVTKDKIGRASCRERVEISVGGV